MSDLLHAELAAGTGFRSDPRFAPEPAAIPGPADPVAQAWSAGHAAGRDEALAKAAMADQADSTARDRIRLALARLDAEQTELLRQRLLTTVEVLCEAAIAPLALDRDALAVRVTKAAAMLARADDDKVLRLHPEDLRLIADSLPEGIETQPDQTLERGALRIETAVGGVEDGPAQWRRAITAALTPC